MSKPVITVVSGIYEQIFNDGFANIFPDFDIFKKENVVLDKIASIQIKRYVQSTNVLIITRLYVFSTVCLTGGGGGVNICVVAKILSLQLYRYC